MDRSKLIVAMALVFTLVATLLSIINISISSSKTAFVSQTQNFFTTGSSSVALIEIHGVIQDGSYGDSPADRIVADLDAALHNPSILGVILAINSPGGTVGGTKKIYTKVKEVAEAKHVVAVVTDVAASGGYYIACAADRIYAYRSSVIGSIGVISLRPNFSGLLDKYGVRIETLKAGRHKDMSYPFRELSDEERKMYNDMLQDMYQLFKSDVREGRKVSIETVDRWAEGRIYSGQKAKSLQMIDDFGGLDDAMAFIARESKRAPDDLQLVRPKPDFWSSFWKGVPLKYQQHESLGRMLRSPAMYLYPGTPDLDRVLSNMILMGGS